MPSTALPATLLHESVIPDCCNIGVIFRVMAACNGIMLLVMLAPLDEPAAGLRAFVEASPVLELAGLASLGTLCALRRAGPGMPLWLQRVACALIPAILAGLLIRLMSVAVPLGGAYQDGSILKSMLAAAVFGLGFQHYFELRTRAYSPVLAEARLQALQARIRPHFLFNSLNAVLSLIRSDPRRAENTLEDLADLFRVLVRDARDLTSLEEEIRLSRQYLSIEKIRLGDRLQVDWDFGNISEGALRRARIPALLLQPLFENAVHYGVEPVVEPVTIRVRMSRSIDRIEIVVLNPYHGDPAQDSHADSLDKGWTGEHSLGKHISNTIGNLAGNLTGSSAGKPVADSRNSPAGNHMALDNIRERLALLYDVEAQLTTTVENGNFEVRLRFPYVKARA